MVVEYVCHGLPLCRPLFVHNLAEKHAFSARQLGRDSFAVPRHSCAEDLRIRDEMVVDLKSPIAANLRLQSASSVLLQ
jgi:hypothetical protein